MALLKFFKGLSQNLSHYKAKEGSLYITTDDKKIYLDVSGDNTQDAILDENRICLNDHLPISGGTMVGPLCLTQNVNYGEELPETGNIGQIFIVKDKGIYVYAPEEQAEDNIQ